MFLMFKLMSCRQFARRSIEFKNIINFTGLIHAKFK